MRVGAIITGTFLGEGSFEKFIIVRDFNIKMSWRRAHGRRGKISSWQSDERRFEASAWKLEIYGNWGEMKYLHRILIYILIFLVIPLFSLFYSRDSHLLCVRIFRRFPSFLFRQPFCISEMLKENVFFPFSGSRLQFYRYQITVSWMQYSCPCKHVIKRAIWMDKNMIFWEPNTNTPNIVMEWKYFSILFFYFSCPGVTKTKEFFLPDTRDVLFLCSFLWWFVAQISHFLIECAAWSGSLTERRMGEWHNHDMSKQTFSIFIHSIYASYMCAADVPFLQAQSEEANLQASKRESEQQQSVTRWAYKSFHHFATLVYFHLEFSPDKNVVICGCAFWCFVVWQKVERRDTVTEEE